MTNPPKPKGFAAISPERRREIASMGGKAVPKDKRSFSQSPSLAASAGRTGGLATQSRKEPYGRGDNGLPSAAQLQERKR